MMTDALVCFVQPGGLQSLIGAAGAVIQVGSVIDMLGQGVNTAPANIIGNAFNGFYGVDPGVGRMKPEIQINIGVAFATANAATGEFALQYAPDTGAAGGYAPGTWEDGATSGFKAVGLYPALTVVRMDLPPAPPATPNPRYVRLIFRPLAATNLSAGTVTFAGLVMARDDLVNRFSPNNFVAA